MAEQTSVELGKSLLAQQQKRTRQLQKSSDKKFFAAMGIGAYDAYSKTKGTKAYEDLYSSFEPILNKRANEFEQSTAFLTTHDAYLKPSGQNAPVFGANQWEEALLYNEVMKKVRAMRVGDSGLSIDVQKEMDKLREKEEWKKYTANYENKLTAAKSFKLNKTIDEEGKIVYSDPLITKLQKVAKQMSRNYGIMPDLLRVLGVGTSADLATQTFTDRQGVSYEILLPEADTPAKQKLQAALLAEMERGTFDDATEAEIASGLTSVQANITPASTFEIDLAKLSKMADIEASINDIQDGRTAYPAYIEEAVYTTADGTEHNYTTILESFDTELEKENFYRDWKRTAAQMYNVITDPEITALGGGITQDQFMQMAFEELLRRNKTTLEAGTFFGINTRYESMSPAEQYNLVASIVETYTANEEDNLSEEEQQAIEERKQQFEQATNAASREDPSNPVNLVQRIPEDFVFSSEEAKSNQIQTDIKFFKEQGYSDEDIDIYRSRMEEIGVDPTGAMQKDLEKKDSEEIKIEETVEDVDVNKYAGMSEAEARTAIMNDIRKGNIRVSKPMAEFKLIEDIVNKIKEIGKSRVERARENPRIASILNRDT